MKKLLIYEAKDGKRFDNKSDCFSYELIISSIVSVMSNLRNDIEPNSTTAVKQDIFAVKEAFKDFMGICAAAIPEQSKWFEEAKKGKRHISHIEYILSEYAHDFPVLRRTIHRFICISENGIEYEQAYFAEHEEEFKGTIS